ncbi:hypothetical protein DY000_02021071 [Brassica cretica]|uniref:Uncharacterized protein n=1 Tax=Brassica cretica TaxID=69181 RepID=A0ABQ7EG27_BRACR|nr:hypothetical protein DY000_02021071 [Brassica cretica]
MKNGEMKQSKKLLEDIARIAWNCLTVFPSQEGKSRLHLWIRTCRVLDIWSHHRRILRQCPQESPLANGYILIDGQKCLMLLGASLATVKSPEQIGGVGHRSHRSHRVARQKMLSKEMISGILDKISQAAREESQGVSWIRWYKAQFIQLAVGSKSVSGGSVIAEQFDQMVEQRSKDICVDSLSNHGFRRRVLLKCAAVQSDAQVQSVQEHQG